MLITQAYKTIIFEEFNDGKRITKDGEEYSDRLDYILGGRVTESTYKEIEKRLGVSSYAEFLEKFNPIIYEQQQMDEDGNLVFNYTTEKPGGNNYKIINITDQKFYTMVQNLYEKKNTSGESNTEFDYESIQEMLTPKKALREARRIRGELEYNAREYFKLEKVNPTKAKEYGRNIVNLRKSITQKYLNGNLLAFLSLALDDVNRKINYIDTSMKQLGNDPKSGGQPPQLQACTVSFTVEGDVEIKALPASNDSGDVKQISTSASSIKLLESITSDIDKRATEEVKNNEFTKNLILSTFCAGTDNDTLPSREVLVTRRDAYAHTYKKAQESFAQQMIMLVEKFLNVRAFFDHASVDGRLEHKVIIANCKLDDLMEDGRRQNFTKYIKTLGKESTDKRLWYAVVPALKHPNAVVEDDDDMNPFGDLEDETTEISGSDDLTSFEAFKQFMSILKDAEIMTFFNFKGSEQTSFGQLDAETVNEYKKLCDKIDEECKEYAVFCYPNFTILPKSNQRSELCKVSMDGVVIDMDGNVSSGEEMLYLDSPSVYLDAAYIACGMMIAAHNPAVLKKCNFPLSSEKIPAVRFDFEGSFKVGNSSDPVPCAKVLTTKMNRENDYSWDDETKNAIDDLGGFGFCFYSQEVGYKGAVLRNSYVHCARTLKVVGITKKDKTIVNQYYPIFKPLVRRFVEMYFESLQDWTSFKSAVSDWGMDSSRKYINNPMYDINYGDESEIIKEYISVEGNVVEIRYGLTTDKVNIKVVVS